VTRSSVEDAGELRQRKAALRAGMRSLRNTIPPEERIRLARNIEGHLLSLALIDEAGAILLFEDRATAAG
jgi:hypothetical protein